MNAGRIIFHGSVQEAENLFCNMNLKCPPCYNPAEHYVNCISDSRKCANIVDFIASKGKFESNYDDESAEFIMSSSSTSETSLDDENNNILSWLRQCKIISHRAVLNFFRSPRHYLIELLILIVSKKVFFCYI